MPELQALTSQMQANSSKLLDAIDMMQSLEPTHNEKRILEELRMANKQLERILISTDFIISLLLEPVVTSSPRR